MTDPITTFLTRNRTRRTNFLTAGVTLCSIIAAICVAPLAFVQGWIAVWLLTLLTVIILGTFGIWFFTAVKYPHLLNSEENAENLAALSVLGTNRIGDTAEITTLIDQSAGENPALSQEMPK